MMTRFFETRLRTVWAWTFFAFLARFVFRLYTDFGVEGMEASFLVSLTNFLLTALALLVLAAAIALTIYRLGTLMVSRVGVIAIPMVWLFVFFLLPFLFVFVLSFSAPEIARPPYQPITSWDQNVLNIKAQMVNYQRLITDNIYIETYLSSVWMAFWSTIFALFIGYPMAYVIARAPEARRNLLLMLVILPFWTSFLLRIYSLIGLTQNTGQINTFLIWIGLIDDPIQMIRTNFAVYLGITYSYLPFMILPLYANLVRIEEEILEASADLGAAPFFTFWQVVVPLSMSGILAGSMLVFIPAVGEFVIPELLGGPDTKMIGKLLWVEFFNNRDWPMASALAIVMLILVVVPFMYIQRKQAELEEAAA